MNNRGTNLVWTIVVILLAIGIIWWIMNTFSGDEVESTPTITPTPTMVAPIISSTATTTVTGEYVCLPHRDTSGPTTMECAFGLQEETTGQYYGLNTADLMGTTTIDMIDTGNMVRIQGVLGTSTPQFMTTYNVEGTIRVFTIEEI